MMQMQFRKKPVVIEAIHYSWAGTDKHPEEIQDDVADFMDGNITVCGDNSIEIDTLEGVLTASPGDWIIKGVAGEFYPCKPEIFAETYDAVSGIGESDPAPSAGAEHSWFSQAALDVTAERRRQIEAEGFTPREDDMRELRTGGRLLNFAAAFLQGVMLRRLGLSGYVIREFLLTKWNGLPSFCNPKNDRADLVRAAALIIAEIERIDRTEGRA